MPPKKNDEQPVYQPTEDERGRLRLDRPFSPEEALKQDEDHRQQYAAQREETFRRLRRA